MPALQSARPNLNETLRDAGARGASAGRARQRLAHRSLVVGEVALSLVLLVGAALLIRSFLGMQSVKPGFDPSNLLTMRVTLSGPALRLDIQALRVLDRFLDAAQRAAGHRLGVDHEQHSARRRQQQQLLRRRGSADARLGSEPLLEIRWVSPKYLETLRIPLRRGRMFTQQEWADSGVTGRVAVINEYMAQKFWKTADEAIGKRFRFGNVDGHVAALDHDHRRRRRHQASSG